MPATYTWNGAVDGLWSNQANWTPNTAVPGANDTSLFNNTNNNSCVMDVALPAMGRTVGVLKIDGYTGTLKLQTKMSIDVLTMTSGKVTKDTTTFGGVPTLHLRQDGASQFSTASSWTGGEINVTEFWVVGYSDTPATLNVGAAGTTPIFSGTQWYIMPDATVNWNAGNISMVPAGALGAEILNRGSFYAKSTGKISAPAGKTWIFTNSGYLMLKGDNQFENGRLIKKPGSTTRKTAGLGGSAGTFTLVGEVIQEGGTLDITDGIFLVTASYTQNDGTVTVGAGTTLHVMEDYDFEAGSASVASGATLNADGELDMVAGTLSVAAGTVIAAGGLDIQSGGTLYGWGLVTADVTTAGTVAATAAEEVSGTLEFVGHFTQTGGTVVAYAYEVNLTATLLVSGDYTHSGGTTNADGMVSVTGDCTQTDGTTNVSGTLLVTGGYTLSGGTVSCPGGTFDVGSYTGHGGDFVTNYLEVHGDFLQDGGSFRINTGGTVEGEMHLDGGMTYLSNEGTLTVTGGAFIGLGGSVEMATGTLHGDVENAGSLSINYIWIGVPYTVYTIDGDYTQTSSGSLAIGVDSSVGTGTAVLTITGGASLAGSFGLAALNGWVPGSAFLIQYGGVSGEFDSVGLPPPPPDSYWVWTYGNEWYNGFAAWVVGPPP